MYIILHAYFLYYLQSIECTMYIILHAYFLYYLQSIECSH